jgi:hypothetical protein
MNYQWWKKLNDMAAASEIVIIAIEDGGIVDSLREKVYFMSLKIMRSGGREVGRKREDMQCLS